MSPTYDRLDAVIQEAEGLLREQELSSSQVSISIDRVNVIYGKITKIDDSILDETPDELIDTEMMDAISYGDKILTLMSKLRFAIQNDRASQVSRPTTSQALVGVWCDPDFRKKAEGTTATAVNLLSEQVNINDRLAAYIDRVRELEPENSRLTKQIETSQETRTRDVTSVKNLYERELAEARQAVDDTTNERARLQLEAKKWQTNAEAPQAKLNKRERVWSTTGRRATTLESRVFDHQGRLNQALTQLKDAENQWDALAKELERVNKESQDQILHCTGLSNRAKQLNEQLDVQKSIDEKELEEMHVVKQTEITEIDGRLQENFQRKLADTLQELHEQYESQMQLNREKMQSIYETNMRDPQKRLDRRSSDSPIPRDELHTYKTCLDDVKSRIAELESLNQSLSSCVWDLEQLLKERDWNTRAMMTKDDESEDLLNRLFQKRGDLQTF
ncbi:lamin Dm0 [Rhipicephalus microplus]|uniref:lamin Dm0 n=1 Tax=Rhipicephalus microplus TaxID=6941 RepID=UPI003F6D858F